MHVDTQYGKDLISRFRPEQVSQLVTTGLKKSNLVVSRLRCDTPGHGFAEPHAIEPAFSVILQLREQPARELFLGERCVHRGSYPARTTSICNHLERPKANLISPFDMLFFSVPQMILDEIADDQGVPRIDNLSCERGVLDETVWYLGRRCCRHSFGRMKSVRCTPSTCCWPSIRILRVRSAACWRDPIPSAACWLPGSCAARLK